MFQEVVFILLACNLDTHGYDLSVDFRQRCPITCVFSKVLNLDHVLSFDKGLCCLDIESVRQAALHVSPRLLILYLTNDCVKCNHLELLLKSGLIWDLE